MMRGSLLAALLLVYFCLAVTNNAEAGRTHELFAQSSYYESDGAKTPSSSSKVDHSSIEGDDLPMKTVSTTDEDSPSFVPVETPGETRTDSVASQNRESTAAGVKYSTVFADTPQEEEQQQQHYRDFRGGKPTSFTSTATRGDFMPDARPWWFSPNQYASYGNHPQQGSIPQQQQYSGNEVIPNRYPLGYHTQYYNPQQFYSQSSIPVGGDQYSMVPRGDRYSMVPRGDQYSMIQRNNGQYTSGNFVQQQHYSEGGYPQYSQYSSIVPYEMTGGGCPTQYWISNTQRWPAFLNVKSTVGDALGTPAAKIFGDTTVLQALLNTRPDGYSTLLRTGATAILNSYSRSEYKFTHVQVIESFTAALGSRQAAAQQAAAFEEANVSAYTDQYNSCT